MGCFTTNLREKEFGFTGWRWILEQLGRAVGLRQLCKPGLGEKGQILGGAEGKEWLLSFELKACAMQTCPEARFRPQSPSCVGLGPY